MLIVRQNSKHLRFILAMMLLAAWVMCRDSRVSAASGAPADAYQRVPATTRTERVMEKKTKLHFTYIVEGPGAVGNVDTYFYSHIPVVQTEVIDLYTGRPVTGIPPTEQSISVTGSSIVPCATLAAIIKNHLQNRKSRIVIEGTDKQVEYKGPKLKTKIEEIEKMIYSLTRGSGENGLLIMAYHLSEPG
jgi:hypothetical protein